MKTFIKNSNKFSIVGIFILICVFGLFSASCSTGIESTKTIKMSKEDRKQMAKSAEQTFASGIHGTPLSSWEKGKVFLAMTERTLYIFDPSSLPYDQEEKSLPGKRFCYEGWESRTNPDLREECVILFSDGSNVYRYPTGKPSSEALEGIDSSKLPLLSDASLIEEWKTKINGKTLWTKSNLWYDANGDRKSGLKFAEIKVLDVIPATGDFPMNIKISTPQGEEAYMQMNYTSDLHDSRNFAAIFFLTDPRSRYPQISDENWAMIQKGKLCEGMTKEECKLAIGNPDELNAGHSQSQTMDMWQYANGTYLIFTDGLLTRFRQ